jgi:hypothetical protein
VDLREIARAQRRRQAQDALEFERDREAALIGALEQTAAELEGAGIDEEAFAQMTAEDVEIVRGVVSESADLDLSDELDSDWMSLESDDDIRAERTDEIARLQEEVAESRRRQAAFVRYLEVL